MIFLATQTLSYFVNFYLSGVEKNFSSSDCSNIFVERFVDLLKELLLFYVYFLCVLNGLFFSFAHFLYA